MASTGSGWRRHHILAFLTLSLLVILEIPAAGAFAWLWPDWLHAGHPLSAAKARANAAAAAAATPSSSPDPDVCRPSHLQPPQGSEQDWPEIRSILDSIHPERESEILIDKGPTTTPSKPAQAREEWWDRALAPKLHREFEAFLGETRTPVTVGNYLRLAKRLFREAAPAVFVEGAHNPPLGDGNDDDDGRRLHPVVDTGGVATPLPLASKAQLRDFLHRYHGALEATARALPGSVGAHTRTVLRLLVAFAGGGGGPNGARETAGGQRQRQRSPSVPLPSTTTAPGAKEKKGEAQADMWSRLVSPALEAEFTAMQRRRNRSEAAIAATLATLRRLFAALPLEPYEAAALAPPQQQPSTTAAKEALGRFLRRHYFDMIDLGATKPFKTGRGKAQEDEEEKGGGGSVGEALAELWAFVLVDRRPVDALAWMGRWRTQLEAVDSAAAAEVDRMIAEWAEVEAAAVGAVEMGRARERVLGEAMARAAAAAATATAAGGVAGGRQPALGAEEGGPGALDALEGMVEAVGAMQAADQGFFGHSHDEGGDAETVAATVEKDKDKGKEKGKRAKRRYRRPWVRGPNEEEGPTDDDDDDDEGGEAGR